MSDTTIKTATILKRVLVDAKLEATPPQWILRMAHTPKQKADDLRAWVSEFEDFIRDHRSRDAVQLEVVEVRQDLCSACNREWEPDDSYDGGAIHCANCGAQLEPTP